MGNTFTTKPRKRICLIILKINYIPSSNAENLAINLLNSSQSFTSVIYEVSILVEKKATVSVVATRGRILVKPFLIQTFGARKERKRAQSGLRREGGFSL